MRDDVRGALAIAENATMAERTIDITTTGRRSGEPRRIEICFYRFDGAIYLSGIPAARRRDLRNSCNVRRLSSTGDDADPGATMTECSLQQTIQSSIVTTVGISDPLRVSINNGGSP